MKHLYGYFSKEQMDEYKTKLHKDVFWLLLYKDPEKADDFKDLNYEKYFRSVMKRINGLNSLLFYPAEIVEMMTILEAAHLETQKEFFNFQTYRKLIFDAHSLIDRIGGVESEC